jgi:hypothetical protein
MALGLHENAMTWRAARAVGLATLLLSVTSGAVQSETAPRPSAALPAPADWLDHLNFYRATAGLPPVTEDTRCSEGDRRHAVYIVKNADVQHDEDPENNWYSREGQAAARQSNLACGYDAHDTGRWAIDAWMQSPFHAIGLLDPQLTRVGYGSYVEAGGELPMGAALNVIAGRGNPTGAAYPVAWPGNGATVPIGLYPGVRPNPLTSCPGYTAPSGLPVILQIGPGSRTPAVSATLFVRDGQELEHCVFDETTYSNPDASQQRLGRAILGARDAIVLVPRLPLTAGAAYTASITADGLTYTWTFSVDAAAPTREPRVSLGFDR